MEECSICYGSSSNVNWKILSCQHKLCYLCYLKLDNSTCPYCRKEFIYNKEDIIRRQELNIKYKPYTPPAPLSFIDFIINEQSLNQLRTIRRNNTINTENYQPFSRLNKNRFRNRRRNLTEEEILERRKNIRKRCKKKWTMKQGRLNKIRWYEIQ